ncbi:MAG: pantetheine-phosphate adenylyltransferase [Polyangiales bacterium]
MSIAIYPGSFDPITNGHVDIIRSGLVAFDKIIVGVLSNPRKIQPLFTEEERMTMIRDLFKDDADRIEVDSFEGLLVDYCKRKNVHVILRGLRAVADFEYELQMANMNRHLNKKIETVFIMANDAFFYVSSSIVKEVATLGGSVEGLVPPAVATRLYDKLGRKAAGR